MKSRAPVKRPLRTRKQARNAFDFEEYGSEWIVGGGPTKLYPDASKWSGTPDRGER
jgi:hypothetical protein